MKIKNSFYEVGNAPGIGEINEMNGFTFIDECSDGFFQAGKEGVKAVVSTGDKKTEFIVFENRTIAYVKSNMGYPAYYPVYDINMQKPIKAVLMDLDGTTVKSERFWIWIIQKTVASLLANSKFELEESDLPFVSGHSVSEHLMYCINKYCPEKSVEAAREYYYKHTHYEMDEIIEGRGRQDAFTPNAGIKDFLNELKSMKVKIGLVTSGLYEKAYPEILSAFNLLNMGKPEDFYDCIITAGFPLKRGAIGTIGELAPKPHPWLYSEAFRIGMGMPFEERNFAVGIEDSGAGISSVRLAGLPAIGISGGNIVESGTKDLCNCYCDSFEEILKCIK